MCSYHARSAPIPIQIWDWPFIIRHGFPFIFFVFIFLLTLLHSTRIYLSSFHKVTHSSAKPRGVGVPPSGPPFRSASSKLFEELPRGLPGWFAEIALAMALRNQATQALKVQACFPVLGVRVDAVQIIDVVAQMEEWIREKAGCHSIAATGMHGIVEAQHDPEFKQILKATDLVVPDGMPLVWLGRRQGHLLQRRVYGPDLLLAFCERSAEKGYRHFFYGGKPGVAERLADRLKTQFVGMNIVGTNSHPHRPLSPAEEEEIVAMISSAAPDVLWLGLGEPKQDRWMHERKDKLRVPVLVGVGAAFDMLSGGKKQAPRWMRDHGLEWFFRLMQEPRRLGRRYLVYGAQFIAYIVLESLGLKKFDASGSSLQKGTQGHQART